MKTFVFVIFLSVYTATILPGYESKDTTTTTSPPTTQQELLNPLDESPEYEHYQFAFQSNLCLSVREGHENEDAVIELSECKKTSLNQMWQALPRFNRPHSPVQFRVKHSRKCLTSESDQEGIFQSDCDKRNLNQLWTIRNEAVNNEPALILHSESAEKCLNGLERHPITPGLKPCGGKRQFWTHKF